MGSGRAASVADRPLAGVAKPASRPVSARSSGPPRAPRPGVPERVALPSWPSVATDPLARPSHVPGRRFRVSRIVRVPIAEFPTDRLYAPTLEPSYRLVRCGGRFDRAIRSYRDLSSSMPTPSSRRRVRWTVLPTLLVLLQLCGATIGWAQQAVRVVAAGATDGQARLVVDVRDAARSPPPPQSFSVTADGQTPARQGRARPVRPAGDGPGRGRLPGRRPNAAAGVERSRGLCAHGSVRRARRAGDRRDPALGRGAAAARACPPVARPRRLPRRRPPTSASLGPLAEAGTGAALPMIIAAVVLAAVALLAGVVLIARTRRRAPPRAATPRAAPDATRPPPSCRARPPESPPASAALPPVKGWTLPGAQVPTPAPPT